MSNRPQSLLRVLLKRRKAVELAMDQMHVNAKTIAAYSQLNHQWCALRDQIVRARRQEREAREAREWEYWDTLIRDVREGKHHVLSDPNDVGF